MRKLSVHDHMIHIVKMDIPTGHEEIGNLHYGLKIIFHCIFIEKHMHFLKTCTCTQRIVHEWSFHMKFMKQAFGKFHTFHVK